MNWASASGSTRRRATARGMVDPPGSGGGVPAVALVRGSGCPSSGHAFGRSMPRPHPAAGSSGRLRAEPAEDVLALLDYAVAGLGNRVPGPLQLAQRLGHHDPGVVGDLLEDLVLRIQLTQRGDGGAEVQGPAL